MVGYIINSYNQRFWNYLNLKSFDFEPDQGYFKKLVVRAKFNIYVLFYHKTYNPHIICHTMTWSIPDEGYFRSISDEGYFRSIPDECYFRSIPYEGYFRSISDEGYFRNIPDECYFRSIPVYHKIYNPHITCPTSTFLAQKMTSTADAELMAWPGWCTMMQRS